MAKNNQQFMKRLYGPADLFEQLHAMMMHIADIRHAEDREAVSKQFVERIMMAVTEVNGCRYCSYFHAQAALKEGIQKEEIEQLLSGCFNNAPQEEIPALVFAQHYAESSGQPEPDAAAHLAQIYGERQSNQIVEYIRMIMIGNTWGNAFDALRVRLRGKPAHKSTFWKEIGVILGPFWMIPVILIRKTFAGKQTQKGAA